MTINKQHFWIDREHPRIAIELPCEAGPVGGARNPAIITDLSAGGLKFTCNRAVFKLLLPEDQRIPGQVSDVDIDIRFQLHNPGHNKPLAIRSRAHIIHTERLAQDSYTLGIQFIALQDSDRSGIMTFIEAALARTERR